MFRLPSLRSLVNGARSRKERRRLAVRNRRIPQRPRLFLEPLEDRTLMAAWAPIGPAPITNGQVAGNLPVSGRVTGVAADPGDAKILYVATSGGGIWKTTDGGAKWTPLTDNPTDSSGNPLKDSNGNPLTEFMGAVAETDATAGANNGNQIVYAGMGEGNGDGGSQYGEGILVSTNGGTNWTLTTGPGLVPPFYRNSISKIAIDPSDKTGGTAYAAVTGDSVNGLPGQTGIWKTTNFGQTWTNMTAAAPNNLSTTVPWTDVVVDPIQQNGNTVVYAATGGRTGTDSGGVYKSTDGGATWQKLNLLSNVAPPALSPVTPSPDGGNIPAGTYYYEVTAVLPTGETTASNVQSATLTGSTSSVALSWSTVTGATAYNVYRSTTPGSFTSPALIATVPPPANGNRVTFTDDLPAPTNGAPPAGNNSTLYGRITLALFDGTYQGNSVNELLVSVANTRANGQGLYKMYKSLDGGASFEDLTAKPNTGLTNYLGGQGNFDTSLAISPQNPNYFFAAGAQTQQGPITYSGSPLESFNGGDNWTDIATIGSVGTSSDTHADAFDASGNLIDGTDGGVFKLTNPTNQNNQSWSSLNTNLNTVQFVGISTTVDSTGNLIVYGGNQDNGTVKYTGALGWTMILGADGGITQVDPSNPNRVYAEQQGKALNVSTNGGTTFKDITAGIVGAAPKFYAPYVLDASGNIYYGTDTLNFSTDQGGSWSAIGTPGQNGFNPTGDLIHDIKVLQSAGKSIVYVSAGNSMFVTQDALAKDPNTGKPNATWTAIPLPNGSVADSLNSIAIDPTDTTGGTAYAVVDTFPPAGQQGQHVYYTTNFGKKWDDISGNLPTVPVFSVLVNPTNGNVYVGTDFGVYSTGKGGTNWAKLGTSLPNAQVRELDYVASTNSLVVGTYGRGAWVLGLTVPTPPAPSVAPSIQFTNISVTPNPFALTATETINVNVSQGGGSVSFAVGGQNVTASVDANGNATVTVTVPLLDVLFPQGITAAFNGVSATANASITARWFALIDSTKDIVWNLFLSAIDKIQADGTQVVTFYFNGSPLLFIAWTPTGQLKGFGMGAG
jgi:photosystem II stability/assembly factor-like uncharacterized protein